MSLSDRINAAPEVVEEKYTPDTEFDGSEGFIQTASLPANEAPDFTAILKQFGYDPAKVRIVGNPRVSRWQQRARVRGTGQFEETWLCAYRFHLAPVVDESAAADLDALVRAARKKPGNSSAGPYWLVFQAGDQQLGKRSRDGS